MPHDASITPDDVRRIARLARLDFPEAHLEEHRRRLTAIIEYARRLDALDLDTVDPMSTVAATSSAAAGDDDVPGEMLSREVLMRLAPAVEPPYLAVPKVHGEGHA